MEPLVLHITSKDNNVIYFLSSEHGVYRKRLYQEGPRMRKGIFKCPNVLTNIMQECCAMILQNCQHKYLVFNNYIITLFIVNSSSSSLLSLLGVAAARHHSPPHLVLRLLFTIYCQCCGIYWMSADGVQQLCCSQMKVALLLASRYQTTPTTYKINAWHAQFSKMAVFSHW